MSFGDGNVREKLERARESIARLEKANASLAAKLAERDARIAELEAAIERETCEWELVHSGRYYDKWRCSKCGYKFVEPRCDHGYTGLEPDFCPKCGKAVGR